MKMNPTFYMVSLACCVAALPAFAIDCSSAQSSQEWDAVIDAWREEVGSSSSRYGAFHGRTLPPEERQKHYDRCTRKLISKARELRIGNRVPCVARSDLHCRAGSQQKASSRLGSGRRKRNLALFSETSTPHGSAPSPIICLCARTLQVRGPEVPTKGPVEAPPVLLVRDESCLHHTRDAAK